VRVVAAVVIAVVLVAALVLFVALHSDERGSSASARGDYAESVDLSHHHRDDSATTGEVAR
jgi:hypothetical protein